MEIEETDMEIEDPSNNTILPLEQYWISNFLSNYYDKYFNADDKTFFDILIEDIDSTPQSIKIIELKEIKEQMEEKIFENIYKSLFLNNSIIMDEIRNLDIDDYEDENIFIEDISTIIITNEAVLENIKQQQIEEIDIEIQKKQQPPQTQRGKRKRIPTPPNLQIQPQLIDSNSVDDLQQKKSKLREINYTNRNFIKEKIKTIVDDLSFKKFMIKAKEISPLVFYYNRTNADFKNKYSIKEFVSDVDLNDVSIPRRSTRLNPRLFGPTPAFTIFGESMLKSDFLKDFNAVIRQYNYVELKKFLFMDTRRQMTPWSDKLKNYFIKLFETKCDEDISQCSNTDKIKAILLFDNIHDFGKSRKGYDPSIFDRYCTNKNCIVNYILELINKNIGFNTIENFEIPLISDNLNFFTKDWERTLLEVLLASNNTYIKKINMKNFDNIFNQIKDLSWSHDTVSKNERKIMFKMNKTNQIMLDSSAFDGFSETFPNFEKRCNFEDLNFTIKNPYQDNEDIIYTFNRNTLFRTFDNKYGRGGENKKDCIENNDEHNKCDYIRADRITSICTPNNQVADHLKDVAEMAIRKIKKEKEKEEPEEKNDGRIPNGYEFLFHADFFLTLKGLGDLAQIVEAKKRDVIFFTQDTMQFLIGAILGTKVIKVLSGNKKMVCYANIPDYQPDSQSDSQSSTQEVSSQSDSQSSTQEGSSQPESEPLIQKVKRQKKNEEGQKVKKVKKTSKRG